MRQDMSFAVVRYGRLCFVSGENASDGPGVSHLFSATKTLGALLTGSIMYQTRDLAPSSSPMTGPLREFDRMDQWLDLTALPQRAVINTDATVAHVLAMVGYSDDLSHGQKSHEYDASGRREINQLIRVIDNVVKQDPRRFGSNAVEAKDRLFAKLGLEHSSWDVELFGYSWYGSLLDMARVGHVILRGGVYNGERLVDSRYVYNMTHPAFEDGSHPLRLSHVDEQHDVLAARHPRQLSARHLQVERLRGRQLQSSTRRRRLERGRGRWAVHRRPPRAGHGRDRQELGRGWLEPALAGGAALGRGGRPPVHGRSGSVLRRRTHRGSTHPTSSSGRAISRGLPTSSGADRRLSPPGSPPSACSE